MPGENIHMILALKECGVTRGQLVCAFNLAADIVWHATARV
ncbi:hypothetical protein SDC9_192264 [bioreactor metagenome]|uniref:Uncharacterized protein n=1 Tax=bioreactor metagenome TaxID=1076179 RepID=A0A645I2Q1_9ZZZZ